MNEIYSITPFTMMDYPEHLACVVWFMGCNMRCAYCYNTAVVNAKFSNTNGVSNDEFLAFLDKRKGKLNAVVFSGGECSLTPSFEYLANEVKSRNFKLKIDTNGSNPEILKKIINLVDFIALDFKAPKEKFHAITASNLYENFIKTLKFLLSMDVEFEVRTTIHSKLLDESDISKMASMLKRYGYDKTYYLQNFLYTKEHFGSLKEQTKILNISDINSPLKIELRNF
ncbi:7-carboxy-7-deazaguanine synthase [Campylobacter majalis]|uniref:7-carboxy-7-deazaguanine synthase n=1 Tax=Campylobacter majalis TaxID=2790656 RepID=A0ABM8Q5Q3_9BACT|nr:anaerobic ribonucleoside-triphosphate reductase activating protein [Campylobacter majalis]CAD7288199.1 7-carboxy-7-deazaguanine synthase [Campylobacter majalis]